jgi:hypothetical protein
VIGALAASLWMAGSASASGIVWGYPGCIHAPTGFGGWTNGTCSVVSNGGPFSKAILTFNGLLLACVFVGAFNGMFDDGQCIFLGFRRGYAVWFDPPTLTVKVKGGPYTWKATIAGVSMKTKCTSMEAKEPEIESGGSTDAKTKVASLEYSGCSVEAPTKCEVNSTGKAAGSIDTGEVEGELVDNAAKTKVETLFKPKTGTVFAEIEFKNKGSETCVLKGSTLTVSGSTLTEGGAEDELKNIKSIEAEEGAGTEEVGEAVEKPKLISEPSSKKYLKSSTGEEAEAALKIGGAAATLTGEAKTEAKFSGGAFKSEETLEEANFEEGPVDLGVEKE